MDIIRDRRVSRLEIVDSTRRRRFSDETKLAIVEESYSGPRQVTATAQRRGNTRFQLNSWRKSGAVRKARQWFSTSCRHLWFALTQNATADKPPRCSIINLMHLSAVGGYILFPSCKTELERTTAGKYVTNLERSVSAA